MKQMTLPVKITLAVGLTETLACVVLTLNSILSANSYYGWLEEPQRLQREQNRDPALTNAAHELKTPLTAISTSLQVLEMDESPTKEDYRVFAARTKTSLARLIKTMDGLIALTNELVDNQPETSAPLGGCHANPPGAGTPVRSAWTGSHRQRSGSDRLYRQSANL